MNTRHIRAVKHWPRVAAGLVIGLLLAACAAPTPQVIEVTTVVTQPAEVIEATTIVEATRLVETVVTATPVPPKLGTGNSLSIGVTQGAGALSPFYCIGGYCYAPLSTLLPGLTTHDDQGQPVAALAESWEANETADIWTLSIRPEAVWSDGEPVTAEDVRFTYETCLHPDTGCTMLRHTQLLQIAGAQAYSEGAAESISGIEVVDEKTVRFTLDASNATFINELWQGIVPQHVLADVPRTELQTHPYSADGPTVVSGPLVFVGRQGDEYYELARNDAYWGEPSAFDTVIMKVLNDDVAAAQLEAGEIEFGRIPAGEAARLSTLPHLDIVFSPGDLVYYWIVNTKKPYLQDPRVRQALMYAMNRPDVLQYTWEGNGTVGVPPFGPDWAVNSSLNQYEYDPEQARALLDEAGWDWSQKIVLMVGPWPDNVKPAEAVHAQWVELGLNVEVRLIAGAAWTPEHEGENWDIGMNGGFWGADPSLIAKEWTCDSWNATVTGWCSEELDALAAQGLETTDETARKAIYDQITQILNEEAPLLPLYATGTPWAINKGLLGVKPPTNWLFQAWNFSEWHR